ncbi:hypothetical protein [Paucisalibacillus sp. EB02]|uniref:hypothetical protein n=1 Tax=Paucisalibacillus sp. EB02 TaxID=1347087 RepID=UPI0004AE28EC|nr:hypothetical protein [Paucisalibacillus sp. EB02]
MNQFEPPYNDDERQFNLPGFGNQGQFPGGGQTGGFFPGGGQFPGGFPGFPGQSPGFPGGGFPGQPGGGQQGAPNTPPPSFTPQQSQFQAFAVDPGAIRGCLFRFTFIWLENGNSFWFFPTFVGRNSVAGFRWRRNRWVYFGIDLNRIASFQCY